MYCREEKDALQHHQPSTKNTLRAGSGGAAAAHPTPPPCSRRSRGRTRRSGHVFRIA